ncbi:hypothetical protein FA95DRAFT_1505005, partial [Auriscalpium vulgare]
ILDRHRRIVAVFARPPTGEDDWKECHREAFDAVKEAAGMDDFDPQELERRGRFPTLTLGVSYGGGQKKPTNLKTTQGANVLSFLMSKQCFGRMAGHASTVYGTYVPKMFGFCSDVLGALFQHDATLRRPFPRSIFTATSFNLGPQSVTWRHVDGNNLAHGFCAVTPIGDYDYTKGGHIYLWEYGVVVEFPPGTLALFPSAIVHHGNTSVQPGEWRASITHFCAGGLFRWVACGFRTLWRFAKEDPMGKAAYDASLSTRLTQALSFFSKDDELRSDLDTVFGS